MKKKNTYVSEALDTLRGVFDAEFDYPRAFNNNGSFINLIFVLIYVVKNNLVKSLPKEFLKVIDKSKDDYFDKLKNNNLDSLIISNEYKEILTLINKIEDQIHEKYLHKEQSIQNFYINVIISELKYFSEGFINPAVIRVLNFLYFINRNRKNIDFRLLTDTILRYRFSNKYDSENLTDSQISSVSPHFFEIKKLKKKKEKIVIYNPFSGLGSFGIAFIDILGLDNVKIINEEINSSTFNLSILRYLVLYDNIDNVCFINRNSLEKNFIQSEKMVGGFNPTTSGNITFGKVYDVDVLISNPPSHGKRNKQHKPLTLLLGELIKKSNFSMICQYGSTLTRHNDEIPFENLISVFEFDSSQSKEITGLHTFCFVFEKQKENKDISMIYVERDNLLTNKALINKLNLYRRKPELTISLSHHEFIESYGINMIDIQLMWFQKNIKNKDKYKTIKEISLPFSDDELGTPLEMGIYNRKDSTAKRIEKLMRLPYTNVRSLFKNKLDFFTKKPDFSAPVTSDGMTVENALKNSKVIKCSCILMSRWGSGFSYFDINENPEGLVINSTIQPIKLKNEFYLKYVITSMFLQPFKDQIDILISKRTVRGVISYSEIIKLKLEVNENQLNQEKIFNKRRDEEIDKFLDYRAEIIDTPTIPNDISVIENLDIDNIDPQDLEKNSNSSDVKSHLILQEIGREKRLSNQFRKEKEKYVKKLKESIGVYTHQLGNMAFLVASDIEGLGSLISKLKNDQKDYVSDLEKINNRLKINIDKIEEYIQDKEKSINEIFNYDKKKVGKMLFNEFSEIVKKCSEGKPVQIDNKLSKYSYLSSGALPFDDFLIISNHEYINDIFDNLIKNSIQHSKSENIIIDASIIMLKKERFWESIQKQSEDNYNKLIDKYSDLLYFKIEFKFDGNSIDKNITYKEYSEYGIKMGKEANKGIGGSIISGGVTNSGGFFYYTNQNQINVFNLYFPIEYANAVDNDIKNDNIYELSEVLWMIK